MLQSLRMVKRRIMRRVDGPHLLMARYRINHGGTFDFYRPKTFTQKLYRRMIEGHYRPNAVFQMLADKHQARMFVGSQVGIQYLIPLLWNGEDPSQIPFDRLPTKSIALTNHGSGFNVILDQSINRAKVIAKLRQSLDTNYYWVMREPWYYDIKPRVMIEELLDDGYEDGPLDYRFWCFGGKPAAIQMDNRHHTLNPFYSPDWEPLGATYRSPEILRQIPKPSNLTEMLSVASILSKPFDFVRIDLYSVKGKTYFGEFTFSPTAGVNKFDPPEWDLKFGEMWR